MKLCAVWGSSGAGKSTLALALASTLSKNADTLLISADSRTPMLPVLLPSAASLNTSHSIGSLSELSTITEAALKDRIHRHPKSEHLFIMGVASGEIAGITYKPLQRPAVMGLLQTLQQSPFQYCVVDCDANPVYDALALYALENADAVLRVLSPDIKGFEFQKSQLAWLGNSDTFHVDRHLKISNCCLPSTPLKEAAALFNGFHFSLPYVQEVNDRFAAGELLRGLSSIHGIKFERAVTDIVQGIEVSIGD